MQASTSSRRGDHEQATVMCLRCNIKGRRNVDEANLNLKRRLLSEIEMVKHELKELKMMLKILENGQSILVMLEITSTIFIPWLAIYEAVMTQFLALLTPLSATPLDGSESSSSSYKKLSDSSDPSTCHSLKSLSSLSSWSLSSSSDCPKFSSTLLSNTSPLLFVVGIMNTHQNHASLQPNPVTICGKWPPLVFLTRRMSSKPSKLRQLHFIFHS
ncbi:hypothetical protein Cgig2_000855 [Carnegiea gigantea]|uniref:Uncharacterized protein n=1 Tax=Carnegiea gigantea TaxID=171969 RepID=A0A9Q1JZS3_9CARY|nr:hypothetical protein Cgig2_000855 [Carnegiea gigantea]